MNYWLMKSEPDVFGIDHLKARKIEPWDGVRNYQARNFLREMALGDQAFLYHSSCEAPGIAGLMEIVKTAYPDPKQFDPKSPYFDAGSHHDEPRWSAVDVGYQRQLKRVITLDQLRANADALGDFRLLARGNRLSVLPVTAQQWQYILKLEKS